MSEKNRENKVTENTSFCISAKKPQLICIPHPQQKALETDSIIFLEEDGRYGKSTFFELQWTQ